ncbi:phosphotransferase enzyme family protein [Actinosynnema mirum]|uniref:phosphotransferase enzyme family protein n=1 Tax=Actinosynnema mirum TaxID=40567 RepID=UPI001180D1C7|nr:aminoglycoside phosphotransferase family protein [Actinosynnema mirum]
MVPVNDAQHENPPLTPESAETTLRAACELVELDSTDAVPLRLGENALFHLPSSGAVVRIARSMARWADTVKEVTVSCWLANSGIPVAHLFPGFCQPVVAAGRPVSFWAYLDGRNGGRTDVAALGRLLRRVHSLNTPRDFSLPVQQPMAWVLERVESAPIPDEDKRFLQDRFTELTQEVQGLTYPLATTPVHGDAHVQNLMIVDDNPVLIDFERFAWGQPEWDLALTATEHLTAGWWTPQEYDAFADAYGYDVTDWGGFPVLQAAHEIKMTTWIMQNAQHNPEIAREYEIRMGTLRDRANLGGWRPF